MSDQGSAGVVVMAIMGFAFAIALLIVASMWKMFDKAGKPGWASVIPIYNVIVMLEMVGRPLWWIVLFCLPFVNFIAALLLALDLARSFGKETGFAIGMIFLPFIFYPMLGFGDAQYQGPVHQA